MSQNVPCQGVNQFCKTQGIVFAQVVNSVILKIQDIAIFAVKFSKSVSLMKLAQGKHREFVNRILVGTLLFNP